MAFLPCLIFPVEKCGHGRPEGDAHQRLDDRRKELSQGRKEQVAIAGNATPESVEAELARRRLGKRGC
jgi:hypothetical protein